MGSPQSPGIRSSGRGSLDVTSFDVTSFDVIVLGGGVMGAATAEALARRGRRTLLLERFEPAHARGSSHGDGRIIRYSYPEPVYVEMARRAYRGWARLEAAAGETLVETTGGWECAERGSPALEALEESFRRAGVAYERLDPRASRERFPHFRLEEGSEALYQADGGIVRAGRAVRALWRLARLAGAMTLTGERVIEVDADRRGVALRSASGGEWRAKALVLAAGGWSRGLLAELGVDLPLRVTEETVAYFRPPETPDHRLGAMPTFIDHHTENPFYGLPVIDVPGVKVGWHRTGTEIDPDRPQGPPEPSLRALRDYLHRRLPQLEGEPIEVTTCLYSLTPDYHFVLDRHPELPSVVFGAGFSGHGFKFAPVVAEVLTAMVLGEASPVELETFHLGRFDVSDRLRPRRGA